MFGGGGHRPVMLWIPLWLVPPNLRFLMRRFDFNAGIKVSCNYVYQWPVVIHQYRCEYRNLQQIHKHFYRRRMIAKMPRFLQLRSGDFIKSVTITYTCIAINKGMHIRCPFRYQWMMNKVLKSVYRINL